MTHSTSYSYKNHLLFQALVSAVLCTSSAVAQAQSKGSWQQIDALDSRSTEHVAVQQSNGKVLVACGSTHGDYSESLNKVQQLNLATLKWETLPLLPFTADRCAATPLRDSGGVLVSGGVALEPLAEDSWPPYLYTEQKPEWVKLPQMNEHRYAHSVTELNDGRILAVGGILGSNYDDYTDSGSESSLNTVEIYGFESQQWSLAAPMATARYNHQTFALKDGRILVAGGQMRCAANCVYAEIYDFKADQWQSLSLPGNGADYQWGASAATLLGDQLYVISAYRQVGDDRETFKPLPLLSVNIITGQWQEHNGRPGGWQSDSQIATLKDARIIISGGFTRNKHDEMTDSKQVVIYDPVKNTWSQEAPLKFGNIYHRMTVLDDGRVLFSGGNTMVDYMMELAYMSEVVVFTPGE